MKVLLENDEQYKIDIFCNNLILDKKDILIIFLEVKKEELV